MEENIRLWRVSNNALSEIQHARLDLEEKLESWIEKDISILSGDLLIIGRQIMTDYGGIIDLLCLDELGDIVIVELKRHQTPREVTAQALDYASWVKNLSNERITTLADEYLASKGGLSSAFKEKFQLDLPSVLNGNHKMLIVGSNIDDSTMRIINYLSEDYGVGINYATFQYFKEDNGEFLARIFLINPDEVEKRSEAGTASKRNSRLDFDQLSQIANERGVGDLFNALVEGLKMSFDGMGRTRSSLTFKGRRGSGKGVMISLIPKDEEQAEGLKFQIYEKRLLEYLGIERNDLISVLPRDHHAWEYVAGSGPDWCGYEGRFTSMEEVKAFLHLFNKNDRD